MTMSISSAPWAATQLGLFNPQLDRRLTRGERRSDRAHFDASFPSRRARTAGTRRRVDAHGGRRGDTRVGLGLGRIALVHSAVTLPRVSCPSSVVRSHIDTASSSAKSFDSRLIERFASDAARSSAPTWSTEPIRGSRTSPGHSKAAGTAGDWVIDQLYRQLGWLSLKGDLDLFVPGASRHTRPLKLGSERMR